MTRPAEEYEVGYRHPPKHTRWKKGQCGNPNRIRKRDPKPAVKMIDEFFASKIEIVENGIPRQVSCLEAVILQLWLKTMAGNKRAIRVLLKYSEFAASRGDNNDDVQRVETVIIDPKEAGGKND